MQEFFLLESNCSMSQPFVFMIPETYISRYFSQHSLPECLPKLEFIFFTYNCSMSQLEFIWFQKCMVFFPNNNGSESLQGYLQNLEFNILKSNCSMSQLCPSDSRYLWLLSTFPKIISLRDFHSSRILTKDGIQIC